MDDVIRQARTDVHALQDGGVDGLLIANEFSMPYQVKRTTSLLLRLQYMSVRSRRIFKFHTA
jgi:predicted TIM-barrel enzyme